jgi:hypothetical protein
MSDFQIFIASAVAGGSVCFMAGWQSRAWWIRTQGAKAARRLVQYVVMEWLGFDRPDDPGESTVCDRRHEAPLPGHKSSDVTKPEMLRHAPTVRLCKEDFRPTAKDPAHPNIF